MPSKCKPNNTASKKNLAKKNAQLTAELAKHKERAERAESAYRKLEKRQKLQRAREHAAERKSPRLIERPPGQNRRHGWRLIDKMELGENSSSTADEARKNKLLYNTMLDAVRRAMYGAHWDFSKGIKQSPEVMSKVYTEACQLQPRLTQYRDNWAIHEIALQYSSYRAAQLRKMPGGDLMVGGSKENNHPAGSSPESHSLKAQAKQRPVLGSNNSAPKWGESIEQNAIDLYNKLMSLSDDSDDSEDDM